jgi:hypothetical protein
VIVAGVLVGCGSDNNGGTTNSGDSLSGSVSRIGSVEVGDAEADFSLQVSGGFLELVEPVTVASIQAELAARTTSADECDVFVGADEDYVPSTLESAAMSASLISAGEVLTISGPSGTLGEVSRQLLSADPDAYVYAGRIQASAATATNLVLDIPGEDFPAFSAVAVPDITPFVLSSVIRPMDAFDFDIPVDTTYTWLPANDSATSRVILDVDLTSESNLFEETRRVVINCSLLDDGSFTLPADVQSELTDAGFDGLPFSIGRSDVRLQQVGDALMFIQRSSGIEL